MLEAVIVKIGGEKNMANKLFVGGLSWDTTDATLKDFFSQAGQVLSATVILDKFTGKSRGFGFVEMSTTEETEKAKQLNGQSLDGRAVAVNEARPQEPRNDNFSRGFDRRDDNRGGGNRNFRDNRRGR